MTVYMFTYVEIWYAFYTFHVHSIHSIHIICISMYVYQCVYINVCISMYVYKCMYINVCISMCVYQCMYINVCISMYVYQCMYINVCISMYVYQCICILYIWCAHVVHSVAVHMHTYMHTFTSGYRVAKTHISCRPLFAAKKPLIISLMYRCAL